MGLFFVSCPLGFEQQLENELKGFWFEMMDLDGQPTRSVPADFEVHKGGIELNVEDHLGFQINFFSKLANRVLLRIAKFEARYFDQFEKALSKVEFEKYLDLAKTSKLQLKIETHKSRLNNEKNLTEAATNVFKKKNIQIDDKAEQILFIRAEKDRFMISLDTSGEHLHRRGYAEFRGEAPLRETLAAYLVRKLKVQVDINDELVLLDPFAGSGTILFEALSSHLPLLERTYPWLNFKNAPKIFKSDSWKKNYRWFSDAVKTQCFAYDIDPKAIKNLEHNQIKFQKIFNLNNVIIKTEVLDSAELGAKANFDKAKKVWAVTNPPYGIRMADDKVKSALENLEVHLDGLIVIHPSVWKFNFKKFKLVEEQPFNNQGLDLKLTIWKAV